MHETKYCIRAHDGMAKSKGKFLPSFAKAQAAMENNSLERKQEHANQSMADKEPLQCVQLH